MKAVGLSSNSIQASMQVETDIKAIRSKLQNKKPINDRELIIVIRSLTSNTGYSHPELCQVIKDIVISQPELFQQRTIVEIVASFEQLDAASIDQLTLVLLGFAKKTTTTALRKQIIHALESLVSRTDTRDKALNKLAVLYDANYHASPEIVATAIEILCKRDTTNSSRSAASVVLAAVAKHQNAAALAASEALIDLISDSSITENLLNALLSIQKNNYCLTSECEHRLSQKLTEFLQDKPGSLSILSKLNSLITVGFKPQHKLINIFVNALTQTDNLQLRQILNDILFKAAEHHIFSEELIQQLNNCIHHRANGINIPQLLSEIARYQDLPLEVKKNLANRFKNFSEDGCQYFTALARSKTPLPHDILAKLEEAIRNNAVPTEILKVIKETGFIIPNLIKPQTEQGEIAEPATRQIISNIESIFQQIATKLLESQATSAVNSKISVLLSAVELWRQLTQGKTASAEDLAVIRPLIRDPLVGNLLAETLLNNIDTQKFCIAMLLAANSDSKLPEAIQKKLQQIFDAGSDDYKLLEDLAKLLGRQDFIDNIGVFLKIENALQENNIQAIGEVSASFEYLFNKCSAFPQRILQKLENLLLVPDFLPAHPVLCQILSYAVFTQDYKLNEKTLEFIGQKLCNPLTHSILRSQGCKLLLSCAIRKHELSTNTLLTSGLRMSLHSEDHNTLLYIVKCFALLADSFLVPINLAENIASKLGKENTHLNNELLLGLSKFTQNHPELSPVITKKLSSIINDSLTAPEILQGSTDILASSAYVEQAEITDIAALIDNLRNQNDSVAKSTAKLLKVILSKKNINDLSEATISALEDALGDKRIRGQIFYCLGYLAKLGYCPSPLKLEAFNPMQSYRAIGEVEPEAEGLSFALRNILEGSSQITIPQEWLTGLTELALANSALAITEQAAYALVYALLRAPSEQALEYLSQLIKSDDTNLLTPAILGLKQLSFQRIFPDEAILVRLGEISKRLPEALDLLRELIAKSVNLPEATINFLGELLITHNDSATRLTALMILRDLGGLQDLGALVTRLLPLERSSLEEMLDQISSGVPLTLNCLATAEDALELNNPACELAARILAQSILNGQELNLSNAANKLAIVLHRTGLNPELQSSLYTFIRRGYSSEVIVETCEFLLASLVDQEEVTKALSLLTARNYKLTEQSVTILEQIALAKISPSITANCLACLSNLASNAHLPQELGNDLMTLFTSKEEEVLLPLSQLFKSGFALEKSQLKLLLEVTNRHVSAEIIDNITDTLAKQLDKIDDPYFANFAKDLIGFNRSIDTLTEVNSSILEKRAALEAIGQYTEHHPVPLNKIIAIKRSLAYYDLSIPTIQILARINQNSTTVALTSEEVEIIFSYLDQDESAVSSLLLANLEVWQDDPMITGSLVQIVMQNLPEKNAAIALLQAGKIPLPKDILSLENNTLDQQQKLALLQKAGENGQRLSKAGLDLLDTISNSDSVNPDASTAINSIASLACRNDQILPKHLLRPIIAARDIEAIIKITSVAEYYSEELLELIIQVLSENISTRAHLPQTLEALNNLAELEYNLPEALLKQLEALLPGEDRSISLRIFNILKLAVYNDSYQPNYLFFAQIEWLIDALPTKMLEQGVVEKLLLEADFPLIMDIIEDILQHNEISPTIVDSFPARHWHREQLCQQLLTSVSAKTNNQSELFYDELETLEEYNNYGDYSRERDQWLRLLIKYQNKHSLDLEKLSEILSFITHDPQLSERCLKEQIDFKVFKDQWMRNALEDYILQFNITSETASQINKLFGTLGWSTELILRFLPKIDDAKSLHQITHLLETIDAKGLHVSIIEEVLDKDLPSTDDATRLKLQQAIEERILVEIVTQKGQGTVYLETLKSQLITCLNRGLRLDTTEQIVRGIKAEDLLLLLNAAVLINTYQLTEESSTKEGVTVSSILTTNKPFDWEEQLYRVVTEIKFANNNVGEKDERILLEELRQLNPSNPITSNITMLRAQLHKVREAYLQDATLLPQGKVIKEWLADDIAKWTRGVMSTSKARSEHFLPEILAVAGRANVLHTGYELRNTQLISLLSLLIAQDRGRLAQIATGEGKSTISSILAVIKVLQGEKVDVITSSPILAKRDAEERAGFFAIFGITVSHNATIGYNQGLKECYGKDVVYGGVSDFQYDILRHEYKNYGTRGTREFANSTVIIDEVDSMLIDESSKIAKLSSSLPGMEYLEPLLVGVWYELKRLQKGFSWSEQEQQLLFVDSASPDEVAIVEDQHAFIKLRLEHYIAQVLATNNIILPKYLESYVLTQKELWAQSALVAIGLQERINYLVVEDNKGQKSIAPVDYTNTGIVQGNTQWSGGVHQFLQIKHGFKITPENLNTSFISNMEYFKRYGHKIYGMTGTLGSQDAQQLLSSTYDLDFVTIPTYKPKCFIELPGILANAENEWLTAIWDSINRESSRQRAALVLCESIDSVDKIERQLKTRGFPLSKVTVYTRNDQEQSGIEGAIESGEVILATNLAGRGTDIKTTASVEANGGLHVCLTFLPSNLRVEQQALGRTSRQGKRGTGQLIINKLQTAARLISVYPAYKQLNTIEGFKQWRDLAEQQRLKEIKLYKAEKIITEDLLFNKFMQVSQELRKINSDYYQFLQLEEKWGLWLKEEAGEDDEQHEVDNPVIIKASSHGFRALPLPKGSDSIFIALTHQLLQLGIDVTLPELRKRVFNHLLSNSQAHKLQAHEILKTIAKIFKVNVWLLTYAENLLIHAPSSSDTIYLAAGKENYYSLVGAGSLASDKEIDLGESLLEEIEHPLADIEAAIKQREEEALARTKAAWLQKRENLISKFERFSEAVLQQYNQGHKFIQNPCYLTMKGLDYMNQGKYSQAIEIFKEAINLDDIFSFGAHYNLAYALIQNIDPEEEPEKSNQPLAEAQYHLEVAKAQIEQVIIPQLQSMQIVAGPNSNTTAMSQQVSTKIDVLKTTCNHIDHSIQKITERNQVNEQKAQTGKLASKLIKVKGSRPVRELFRYAENPDSELLELQQNGLQKIFEIEAEDVPKPWASIISVGLLGVGQAIAGIAITIGSAGLAAQFGAQLVIDGARDIYLGYKIAAGEARMDWQDYWLDKAVSVASSMLMAGWAKCTELFNHTKEGLKTIYTGVKNFLVGGVSKEAGRAVATEVSKVGLKTVMVEGTKEGLKAQLYTLGYEISKQTLTSYATDLTTGFVANQLLEQFQQKQQLEVLQAVSKVLSEPLCQKALNKVLTIDAWHGNAELQKRVNKISIEILYPASNKILEISQVLLRDGSSSGLSESSDLAVIGSMVGVGSAIASALVKLNSLLEDFCHQLEGKLTEFSNYLPTMATLLHERMRPLLNTSDCEQIELKLRGSGLLNADGFTKQIGFIPGVSVGGGVNQSRKLELPDLSQGAQTTKAVSLETIDFGEHQKHRAKLVQVLRELAATYEQDYAIQRDGLAKGLSQMVSSQLMNIIQGGLIRPIVSLGVHAIGEKIEEQVKQWLEEKEGKVVKQADGTAEEQGQPVANDNTEGDNSELPLRDEDNSRGERHDHGGPGGDPDSDPDDGDGGGYGRGGGDRAARGRRTPSRPNRGQGLNQREQEALSEGLTPDAPEQKAQTVLEDAQNDNDPSLGLAGIGVLGIAGQKSEKERKQEQARTQLKEGLKQYYYYTDRVGVKPNIPVVVINKYRLIKEETILHKAAQWIKDNPLEAAELGLLLIPGIGLATRGAILAGRGVRWGAKLLLNGKRIRNLAGLKQIQDVGSKASQKFVSWLPKSWRKALSNSKARSNECTSVQEVYNKLQGGKDTDKLQRIIKAKIPENFTESLNREKNGIRWKDPADNLNSIRIDLGNPYAQYESGRVDHVAISYKGQIIGRNGQVIKPTTEFPKPTQHPDAHIPLKEWIKWQNPYKP